MFKTIRFSLPLATLVLGLLLAGPALAAEGHAFDGSFGPEGPGSGAFGNVQGIAVDQASGDVYVYDDSSKSVYKFNASGEKVNFTATGTNLITEVGGSGEDEEELAVDSSAGPDHGDLYVANNNEVLVYDGTSGQLLGRLTGGEMCGVAVDSKGEVYVGVYGSIVNKYTPHTNPVTNADYDSSLYKVEGVCNVAADSAGNVYVNTWRGGVRKYAPSQFNTTEARAVTTPPEAIFDEAGSTLAVDLSNDDVYVDEVTDFAQYRVGGELFGHYGEAGSEAALSGSEGIAVDSTSGAVYVSNGTGVVDIYESTTLPATHTGSPSGTTGTSVELHGDIEDPSAISGGVGYYFTYSEGTKCFGPHSVVTSLDNGGSSATGSGDVGEEAAATGLHANTSYSACFVTVSAHGKIFGEAVHFTTLAAAPAVVGESALGITASGATLETLVNPEKETATCLFEYLPKAQFDSSGYAGSQSSPCEPSSLGAASAAESASASINGLQPATIYHYRVVATNGTGSTQGNDATFTTLPLPPQVSTGQATVGGTGSVQITGLVNPRGNGLWDVEYQIQYGLTAAYGSQLQGQIGSDDEAVSVSRTISELRPGNTYHYRIVAKNAGGESVGSDGTFALAGAPPLVGATGTQFVNEHSTVVLAALNPEGSPTIYDVQYGATAAYGSNTTPLEIAPFTSSQGTITEVVGLSPGTVYHYRLVASNAAGTTYGPDETFTTAGAPLASTFTSFTIPSVPLIGVAPFKFPGASSSAGTAPKALTGKQKLAAALKACTTKPKHKRAACEKQARKRYGPKSTIRKKQK